MARVTTRRPLVLAVNSGSSSLKFAVYECAAIHSEPRLLLSGGATGIGRPNGALEVKHACGSTRLNRAYRFASQSQALRQIFEILVCELGDTPAAVGHRLVHGGPRLRQHQPITPEMLNKLEAAVHFAPLHIPPALKLIRDMEQLLPDVPQYACFDTAFHRTMPEAVRRFALPRQLYEIGIERFGFHGLSYESVVQRLSPELPERVVCAHLGAGASVLALFMGESVDTTMGMTPTGGLPMATRSGDLDPGVLLYLLRSARYSPDQLEELLNRHSGLAALSGGESDMRLLEAAAERGDAAAALAIEVFALAARKAIGACAAELGGLDLLVFTGGIGEHSSSMRQRICQGLGFLGITSGDPAQCSRVRVLPSEEELQIARITWTLHHSTRPSMCA